MSKKEKKKLQSIPAIKRRIFKLLSLICRERVGYKCEICGMKRGDLYNNKPQRVECHHIFSRSIKNSPMKFDLKDVICLCTLHHKTSFESAHKNGIWFAQWLKDHKPEQYQYILDHYKDTIDLDDRGVLEKIEQGLLEEQKKLTIV